MVIQFGRETDPGKRIRKRQGARIREARRLRQLSAKDLAERVGVTEGAVTHWETGRYSPRQQHQVAVSQALEVPWSFLFALDGEVA